mgnify:FL=1
MPIIPLLGFDGYWVGVHDADPRAIALYERHYSNKKPGEHRSGFLGRSERLVLMTLDGLALFAWRLVLPPDCRRSSFFQRDKRSIRRDYDGRPPSRYFGGQVGIMCSIFRNEGPVLSSTLILEAETLAWRRWPGQRLFTYVWDAKVKSPNPGYCFKKASWTCCGRNKDGRLTVLEKWPHSAAPA